MPEPLKNLYTSELLKQLADALKQAYPPFRTQLFLKDVFNPDWSQLELKQRMRHITTCIHKHLPLPYEKQITVLRKTAPGFNGFLAMLFPDFVEVYGLDAPDVSIPALEWFTQFSSSEFAVRPFILRYEKRMLKQHLLWAKHPNHHVRRLASEGIRPRLPWAMALPAFKKNPESLFPILNQLKNDTSEYVRRSVANCLNDISKDHPERVLEVVKTWMGISKETDALVKHACRGLLKQGHTETLSAFGLNHKIKVRVSEVGLSKSKIRMGEAVSFTFAVTLLEKKPHTIRVEYRMHFMKANGKTSGKIFRVGNYTLKPQEAVTIKRSHVFADLTTRKHYPGLHRLEVVINGTNHSEVSLHLL